LPRTEQVIDTHCGCDKVQ